MSKTLQLLAASTMAVAAMPSLAADPIQLKFEGLSVQVGGTKAAVVVDDFYNGGKVKLPGDPTPVGNAGPDLNVVVTGDALAVEAESGGGTGSFVSDGAKKLGTGALVINGTATIQLESGASFNDALSFYLSGSPGASSVRISLIGATGNAEFSFGGLTSCAAGITFCDWEPVVFNVGTLPKGVTGLQILGRGILIDNLTLGSDDPSTRPGPPVPAIPEPSTYALMALGLGAVFLAARRRRLAQA